MRPLLCLLFVASSMLATEWPDVPDPVGLGPRLALLDWLRERQVKPAAGASDEAIIGMYYNIAAGQMAAGSSDPSVAVTWVGDREWQAAVGEVSVNGAAIQPAQAWTKPSGKDSHAIKATARWRGGELTITLPDSTWQVFLGDAAGGRHLPVTTVDGRPSVVIGADLSRPLSVSARRGTFQRTWKVERR